MDGSVILGKMRSKGQGHNETNYAQKRWRHTH